MFWHEELTEEDVLKRLKGTIHESIGGTVASGDHWYDLSKESKDNPMKRFEAGVAGLPLPGAFKESALGLRGIIRDKIKANESYEDYLKELYTLAVWQSFSMKYSERAGTLGHNILERIPGSKIAKLKCDYQDIGYKHLDLINKTDAKRLVAIWGEPKSHTTLLDFHSDLWKKYEDEYIHIRKTKGAIGLYDYLGF